MTVRGFGPEKMMSSRSNESNICHLVTDILFMNVIPGNDMKISLQGPDFPGGFAGHVLPVSFRMEFE